MNYYNASWFWSDVTLISSFDNEFSLIIFNIINHHEIRICFSDESSDLLSYFFVPSSRVFEEEEVACHACNGTSNNLISLPVGEILRSRGVEEILFGNSSLSFSGAKSKGLTHLLLQSLLTFIFACIRCIYTRILLAWATTICVSRVIFHSALSHLFIPNLS